MVDGSIAWPPLPFDQWADTKRTLHRYAQVVGKIRLTLVPFRNHWWHVTLLVGTRGLETGPMPVGDGRTAAIAFDFVEHRLTITTSDGGDDSFDLVDGLSCGGFYDRLFGRLQALGIDVAINTDPYDLDGPSLATDDKHDRYDAEAVGRFWKIIQGTANVLDEFAGWFNGKQSPVHLFWHTFDLATARYSGRPAPVREGADRVTAEAYSHEVIAFGFWPGSDTSPFPAFYSYTSPAPDGLTDQPLVPSTAWWDTDAGTAYVRYDDVRSSPAPRGVLLDFFTSAYNAGATAGDWDMEALATRAAPPPQRIKEPS